MSSFTWLDYSEHDRQKAIEVVRLFAEKGTVDELGIGTVRDAFSDILFPGTSTLHTRARYFFFIPWHYRRLEGREFNSAADLAAQVRKDEVTLINTLAESDDVDGVIGIEARETLKNLPSLLYWQGLQALGFRLVEGGQAAFHRRLAGVGRSRSSEEIRTDDGDPVGRGQLAFWHPGIPETPEGFPKEASFRLTRAEARFFQDRVRERVGRSLLAWLLSEGAGIEDADFPWQHPRLGEMRSEHREQLAHARNFSETMRGAALLYNLMLGERSGDQELIEEYREELGAWVEQMRLRASELERWDRRAMWSLVLRQNPGIPLRSQDFIQRWLDIACDPNAAATVAEQQKVRTLIEHRERALKGGLARLTNQRALERWSGESGTAQLSFRWANVRAIVTDVLSAA